MWTGPPRAPLYKRSVQPPHVAGDFQSIGLSPRSPAVMKAHHFDRRIERHWIAMVAREMRICNISTPISLSIGDAVGGRISLNTE